MPMSLHVRRWTLPELDALPEDGNTYELVHGELLVSPPPGTRHQGVAEVLLELLLPYVLQHRLGRVSMPKSVIRTNDSQVEPDLMVRPVVGPVPERWEDLPVPLLVVEVLSPSSKRNDRVRKRSFYDDLDIPEYWIVDGKERSITIVRPERDDVIETHEVSWHPVGAPVALTIDLIDLFRTALGPA